MRKHRSPSKSSTPESSQPEGQQVNAPAQTPYQIDDQRASTIAQRKLKKHVITAKEQREAPVQGYFTIGGERKTEQEVKNHYATFNVANGNAHGTTLPPWVRNVVTNHANNDAYAYEISHLNSQKKFLSDMAGSHPQVSVAGKQQLRKGTVDVNNLQSMEHWDVGAQGAHAVNQIPADETELAHNAWNKDHFNQKAADPNYGNPGEFGSGFYLTTGHETAPQEAIRDQWKNKASGDSPRDVIKFRFKNRDLVERHLGFQPNQQLNPQQQEEKDLFLHMLQNSTTPGGNYPNNMDEDQAIAVMNRINRRGNTLLFPMTKDKAVDIDGATSQHWSDYTQNNGGPSGHSLVIGPQRPHDLRNIRQIAFRGEIGDLAINEAQRSFQKTAPAN